MPADHGRHVQAPTAAEWAAALAAVRHGPAAHEHSTCTSRAPGTTRGAPSGAVGPPAAPGPGDTPAHRGPVPATPRGGGGHRIYPGLRIRP